MWVLRVCVACVCVTTTMLQATADQTEAETNKTLGEQGTTTTQIEKDLNKAVDDTQKEVDKELKKDESAVVKGHGSSVLTSHDSRESLM